MHASERMAGRATDSLVKLIHFDLAGRYAVALGGTVDAAQAPQDSRTISSVGSRLEP